MLDLEVCISRREMIYNKVAAKDIRLKGKNEMKQTFLKKLDNLRINIKKIKIVNMLLIIIIIFYFIVCPSNEVQLFFLANIFFIRVWRSYDISISSIVYYCIHK